MEIALRPAFGTNANAVADVYLASREAFVSFAPLAHDDSEVRQYIAHILIPGGQVTVAVQEQGRNNRRTLGAACGRHFG